MGKRAILAGLGPDEPPQLQISDELESRRKAEQDQVVAEIEKAVLDHDKMEAQKAELDKGGLYKDVAKAKLKHLGWKNVTISDGRKITIGSRKNRKLIEEKLKEFFTRRDEQIPDPSNHLTPHVFQQRIEIDMRDLDASTELIEFLQKLKLRDPHLIATVHERFDPGTVDYYIQRQIVSESELREFGAIVEDPSEYMIFPKPRDA